MHGGGHQVRPRGDPKNGGAPPTTRLYARHLQPDELAAFDAAPIGTLDHDIKLAKAHLDWAVKQWTADPLGGVVVFEGDKDSKRIRLYSDLVREHQDCVRRLEEARAAILRTGGGGDSADELFTYEAWLAAQKAKAPSGSSSPPSSAP